MAYSYVSTACKWSMAQVICLPALLMPYRIRLTYIHVLSALLHAPYHFFGFLAGFLLSNLRIHIHAADPLSAGIAASLALPEGSCISRAVAVLFSGGSDSTCTAALMAEKFSEVHLVTFYEHATRRSPFPEKNVARLRAQFPNVTFVTQHLSVDRLVRYFWYERYFARLAKYKLLMLATPGFSSLSWHTRMIVYCVEHNITQVVDGLTRELMHFPGHMDLVVEQFHNMYGSFGIKYENPVRDWAVPPDQQFIDRVLVNHHGGDFLLGNMHTAQQKTTGQYLYACGIFPSPNVKGSRFDGLMQHDCYPFMLYNVLAFWGYLSVEPYELFCNRVNWVMKDSITQAKKLLDEYSLYPTRSKLSNFI